MPIHQFEQDVEPFLGRQARVKLVVGLFGILETAKDPADSRHALDCNTRDGVRVSGDPVHHLLLLEGFRMARRIAVSTILLLLVTFPTLGGGLTGRDLAAAAAGCTTTTLKGCNVTERAELASGDCTFSDGRRFDLYSVVLPAGQAVAIAVRPLDPAYTNPEMFLLEPSSHPSDTPRFEKGPAGSLWVKTKVAGTWSIAVSTSDLFAGGEYALHVDCFPDTTPGASCVEQELLCGNEISSSLNAESCRYSADRASADWLVYGVEGDRLTIAMESFAFDPIFRIYNSRGDLLRTSAMTSFFEATMSYRIPEDGLYTIVASSMESNIGGNYTMKLGCNQSGCLFPYLLDPLPSVVKAPLGQPATIGFNVHAIGGFTAGLMTSDIAPIVTSTTSSISTPPVGPQPQRYFLRVENACGFDDSGFFTVEAEVARKRSVRH